MSELGLAELKQSQMAEVIITRRMDGTVALLKNRYGTCVVLPREVLQAFDGREGQHSLYLVSPDRIDPMPMLLTCPMPNCGARHIDEGEFATKPHHTHACQACGHVWRPAIVPTIGVRFLPGFKNEPSER